MLVQLKKINVINVAQSQSVLMNFLQPSTQDIMKKWWVWANLAHHLTSWIFPQEVKTAWLQLATQLSSRLKILHSKLGWVWKRRRSFLNMMTIVKSQSSSASTENRIYRELAGNCLNSAKRMTMKGWSANSHQCVCYNLNLNYKTQPPK